MKTPYSFADDELQSLKQYVTAEFHNTANVMSFDELNIMSTKEMVKELYSKLLSQNERVFKRIAKKCYKNTMKECGMTLVEGITGAAIIAALLARYHPVTQYQYKSEATRKRDRFVEALLSAQDEHAMRTAFNDAAKRWFDQSRQYADFSVSDAMKQAFEDAGVEKVKWMAEHDEKTCKICRELDGQIFKLSDAPEIPQHRHCRCWLVPVLDS